MAKKVQIKAVASKSAAKRPVAKTIATKAPIKPTKTSSTKSEPKMTNSKPQFFNKAHAEKLIADGHKATAATIDKTAEAARTNISKSLKAVDELSKHAKSNTEAGVATAHAAVAGFEAMTSAFAHFMQKSAEGMKSTAAAFKSAKTPAEFIAVQKAQYKAHADLFVAEASQLTETATKIATQVMAPMQNRAAVVMDGMMKAAR